jgi:hypothetical protein
MSREAGTQVAVEQGSAQVCPDNQTLRAAVHRSLMNMLTSSTGTSGRCGLTPVGLVHSVGVSFLEMAIMARGAKKAAEEGGRNGMPTFVDVKLTVEDKAEFLRVGFSPPGLVNGLQRLCDNGYRIGCSWSGETQAYTVSITCRDPESVNSGLCMTSFAKELPLAIGLALYKHEVLTEGNWLGAAGPGSESFG